MGYYVTGGEAYNSKKYFGYFKKGIYDGLGEYSDWLSESKHLTLWRGEWEDGNFTGYGKHQSGRFIEEKTFIEYYGYFENGLLQGPGYMWGHVIGEGVAVKIYGVFKDSEIIEVLSYEDWQEDLAAAAEALRKGRQQIDAAFNEMARQKEAIWSQTYSNISAYRAQLDAIQPPVKVIPIPEYGTKQVERDAGEKLNWIVGY